MPYMSLCKGNFILKHKQQAKQQHFLQSLRGRGFESHFSHQVQREKTTLFGGGYLNRGQAQSELNFKFIGQGASGLVCLQETIRHGKEHGIRAAGEFALPTL